MDSPSSHSEDELKALESRLAEWRPATEGLDTDAMLYSAGMEAGRRGRGRVLWPTLCLALAIACAGLETWGLTERSEHQALLLQVREHAPAMINLPVEVIAISDSYVPSPKDYLQLRRLAEQDPGNWLSSLQQNEAQQPKLVTFPNILRAGEYDRLRDQ